MTDIKTLPFDLEKALAGHPLVTERGIIATDFSERTDVLKSAAYPYQCKVGDKTINYTPIGRCYHGGVESSLDLFLLDTSKSETMENNKELTLLEKFNAGWEIKAYGFKIVDVVQWKNGEHTAMDSDGTVWQYENHESHFTITTPVERRWVNLWTYNGNDAVVSISDTPNTMDNGGTKLTDQFAIIKTENGWKLEK